MAKAATSKSKRPVGINGLAFIFGLLGVIAVITFIPILVSGTADNVHVAVFIIGIIAVILAYGLWKASIWAWYGTIVFSIVSSILVILMLFSYNLYKEIISLSPVLFGPAIIIIIWNVWIIYYFTRKNVKVYFGM